MSYRRAVQTVMDDANKQYVIGCSHCEYLHYYQRDCKTMKRARKGQARCTDCSHPAQVLKDRKGGGIWDPPHTVHETLTTDDVRTVDVTFGNGETYELDVEHVEVSATHAGREHRPVEYSIELNHNVPKSELPDGWETGFVSGYSDERLHPTVTVHGERFDEHGNFIEWTFDGPRYTISSVDIID